VAGWYRVDIPLDECGRNGKGDHLQKAFEVMFITSQKPSNAALFEWHDETLQTNVFFFSPRAAALISSLIEQAGGIECGPPIVSDRLVLLVGDPGVIPRHLRPSTS
jgi:hypothetical protein